MKLYVLADVKDEPLLDYEAEKKFLQRHFLNFGLAPDSQVVINGVKITTFKPVTFRAWFFSRHKKLYRWYRKRYTQKWRNKHGDEA